jgi:hypothetical protein
MPRERSIQLDDSGVSPEDTEDQAQCAPEVQQWERLARVVRQVYILLRSEAQGVLYPSCAQWDGGQDKYGRNHKPIWPKVARFLVARGYEPLDYMRVQFFRAPPGRVPQPNQLTSDAAVELYQTHLQKPRRNLLTTLQWEIESVRSEMLPWQQGLNWSFTQAMEWALRNEATVKASPLVRYCLAVEYGLNDIAELYHDRALVQYVVQKDAYNAAWPAGILPEPLRTAADALTERILT